MNSFLEKEKALQLELMVKSIEERFPEVVGMPLDLKIKKALLEIDRELFVPPHFKHLAYTLDALPMQESQWISSPLTVAIMTHYLEPQGCDSVLEIGCGSGYQAAILSRMVRRVFTIERIYPILEEARKRFRNLGIMNINTRFDDGQRGWKEFAPYDRIIFSASIDRVPDVIFEQLRDGGILMAPIVEGATQIMTRFTKKNNKLYEEPILNCKFVPILNGTQR